MSSNNSVKAKVLFAFLMSGTMAFCMSGILTFVNIGVDPDFISKWMRMYIIAYTVAFPLVLIFAPLIGKIVALLVKK